MPQWTPQPDRTAQPIVGPSPIEAGYLATDPVDCYGYSGVSFFVAVTDPGSITRLDVQFEMRSTANGL